MKRSWLWILGLFIALGVTFRFYQLGSIPISLYWDEAAMLLDAKVVAQTGADMHGQTWLQALFPSYGDYKLPVYIWLATMSVKLLGLSELAVRLPSMLAGLLTILLAAGIAKQLFPHQKKWSLPLSVAAVVAISPWAATFSRTAFEGHLAQALVALSVWLMLKSKEKSKLFLLVPLVGALATYTYFSVRFVWPVILVAMTLLTFGKNFWKWAVPSLLVFMMLLIPMFKSPLYEASNQFRYSTSSILNARDYALESNQLRDLGGNGLVDRIVFHRHTLLLKELAKNYGDHLSLNYLFVRGDQNLRHGTGHHGLYFLILAPFLLGGVYQLFKHKRNELTVLIAWWLAAILPAAIPETTPHALRSLNALIPSALIIGYGLNHFYQTAKSHWHWLVAALIFVSIIEYGYFYFTQYPRLSAYDWQAGYKELAMAIDEQRPHVADIYIQGFDDRFYLWLLAYGSFNPAEIQALETNNFKIEQIPQFTFRQYHWTKLSSLDRKILVAGYAQQLDSELVEYKVRPTWQQDFGLTVDGLPKFKLALIEPQ